MSNPRIALCLNKKDCEAVREAVNVGYGVIALAGAREIRAGFEADLLIVELDGRDLERQWALAACRTANPGLPVLLVARGMDADLAVEVVKLIGDDFISLPIAKPRELTKKIERLLLRHTGPALDREWLVPFSMCGERAVTERRRGPRSHVPPEWTAVGRFVGAARPVLARLKDFSLPQEGNPGSMQLVLVEKTARALAGERLLPSWGCGTRFQLAVSVERCPTELVLDVKVTRLPRPTGPGEFPVIIQYDTRCQDDLDELIVFWARCQAQEILARRRARDQAAA